MSTRSKILSVVFLLFASLQIAAAQNPLWKLVYKTPYFYLEPVTFTWRVDSIPYLKADTAQFKHLIVTGATSFDSLDVRRIQVDSLFFGQGSKGFAFRTGSTYMNLDTLFMLGARLRGTAVEIGDSSLYLGANRLNRIRSFGDNSIVISGSVDEYELNNSGFRLESTNAIAWSSGILSATSDVLLWRDNTGIFGQRRTRTEGSGAHYAQYLREYGAYASTSNNNYFEIGGDSLTAYARTAATGRPAQKLIIGAKVATQYYDTSAYTYFGFNKNGTIDTTGRFTGTDFIASDSLTAVNASLSGNLNFSGTAARITGDFSNGTVNSRTMFQTSTTNGVTSVGFIPNGTADNSLIALYDTSNVTNNWSRVIMTIDRSSALAAITSSTSGLTNYPIVFELGSGGYQMKLNANYLQFGFNAGGRIDTSGAFNGTDFRASDSVAALLVSANSGKAVLKDSALYIGGSGLNNISSGGDGVINIRNATTNLFVLSSATLGLNFTGSQRIYFGSNGYANLTNPSNTSATLFGYSTTGQATNFGFTNQTVNKNISTTAQLADSGSFVYSANGSTGNPILYLTNNIGTVVWKVDSLGTESFGSASLTGDLTVGGQVSVDTITNLNTALVLNDTVNVTGVLQMGGSLAITSTNIFKGALDVAYSSANTISRTTTTNNAFAPSLNIETNLTSGSIADGFATGINFRQVRATTRNLADIQVVRSGNDSTVSFLHRLYRDASAINVLEIDWLNGTPRTTLGGIDGTADGVAYIDSGYANWLSLTTSSFGSLTTTGDATIGGLIKLDTIVNPLLGVVIDDSLTVSHFLTVNRSITVDSIDNGANSTLALNLPTDNRNIVTIPNLTIYGQTSGLDTVLASTLFLGYRQNTDTMTIRVVNYAGSLKFSVDTLGNAAGTWGDWSDNAYGGAYIADDHIDTILVTDAAANYTVGAVQPPSGYPLTTGGVLQNVTVQDSSLTIGKAGKYLIRYSVSAQSVGITGRANFYIFINDNKQEKSGAIATLTNTAYTNQSGGMLYSASANDIIKLKVRSPDDNSGSIAIQYMNITITRID